MSSVSRRPSTAIVRQITLSSNTQFCLLSDATSHPCTACFQIVFLGGICTELNIGQNKKAHLYPLMFFSFISSIRGFRLWTPRVFRTQSNFLKKFTLAFNCMSPLVLICSTNFPEDLNSKRRIDQFPRKSDCWSFCLAKRWLGPSHSCMGVVCFLLSETFSSA